MIYNLSISQSIDQFDIRYGIPQRASSVIRIVPPRMKKINGKDVMEEEIVEMLYCGDTMLGMKDKFEGGVMGNKDGNIYCMPLRAKSVLQVILSENEFSSSSIVSCIN